MLMSIHEDTLARSLPHDCRESGEGNGRASFAIFPQLLRDLIGRRKVLVCGIRALGYLYSSRGGSCHVMLRYGSIVLLFMFAEERCVTARNLHTCGRDRERPYLGWRAGGEGGAFYSFPPSLSSLLLNRTLTLTNPHQTIHSGSFGGRQADMRVLDHNHKSGVQPHGVLIKQRQCIPYAHEQRGGGGGGGEDRAD